MKSLAVIPARYASSRFPGKPLIDILGKSMLQRVYEQTIKADKISHVIIATDDERIFLHAEKIGAPALMTSTNHVSGTDRVAEVADAFPEYDVIVNVQGDEPFLEPDQLSQLVSLFDDKEVQIGTLATPVKSLSTLEDPNQVKVVLGELGNALYFSRQAIPYLRELPKEQWQNQQCHYKHLGLYAFKRDVLLKISQLPVSRLEQLEKLEQLRWLEHGYRIHVEITNQESKGIDTPEDLEALLLKLKKD